MQTLLGYAVRFGKLEVARALLARGADPSIPFCEVPLTAVAMAQKNMEMLKWLLSIDNRAAQEVVPLVVHVGADWTDEDIARLTEVVSQAHGSFTLSTVLIWLPSEMDEAAMQVRKSTVQALWAAVEARLDAASPADGGKLKFRCAL